MLGLLGSETSSYLGTSDHVARTIVANGLRLVLEEHRATTTPTLKSGKPGKTKVAYGDIDAAAKWLWSSSTGRRPRASCMASAGRVRRAALRISQLVLANSQRRGSVLPRSQKDIARKAFERVTKRVLPVSHLRLQRALTAEARTYSAKIDELDKRSRGQRASQADGDDSGPDSNVQVTDHD